MGRINVIKRHKEIDGNVVMENGKPVWEEVRIPYTSKEEQQANRRREARLLKASNQKKDLENLRVKLNLTEEEFKLLKLH